MNDIREFWLDRRESLAKEAEGMKDSMLEPSGLLETYDGLTQEQKVVVQEVLAKWLLSDDEALRHDAAFLIGKRQMTGLRGALERAVVSAKRRSGPGVKYEIKKYRRILAELDG